MLYKSHVLSFVEYRTPGVHFASTSVLNEIDDVQVRFVRQLGLSEEGAFMHFNLAPLCVRRDIGMLGLIHRAAKARTASIVAVLLFGRQSRTFLGENGPQTQHAP